VILDALHRIANHRQSLSREEAHAVMTEVLSGQCSDAQIAALLVALHMKGETVEEIVGFAEAIRAAAIPFAQLFDLRFRSRMIVVLALLTMLIYPWYPRFHVDYNFDESWPWMA